MAFGHQGLCQPSVTHKHCLRLRLLGLAARVGHRHRLEVGVFAMALPLAWQITSAAGTLNPTA